MQCVIRAGENYRGLAGRVASGTIRAGEEVVILPSRQATRIQAVENADGPMEEAAAGDAAVLTLADELDATRGDIIVRRHNLPLVGTRFDAMLCWMAEAALDPSAAYVLLHTTRSTRATVPQVEYRVEVGTLHRQERATLAWNDLGGCGSPPPSRSASTRSAGTRRRAASSWWIRSPTPRWRRG